MFKEYVASICFILLTLSRPWARAVQCIDFYAARQGDKNIANTKY